MTDLEIEVKEVANIVEQTFQLRVTEVVLANDENLREKAQERLSDSLQQVAEDIDRIWKESAKIQDKGKQASKESAVQEFPRSSKDILNVKNSMVGRHDQRKQLKILLSLLRSTKGGIIDMNDEAELENMLQKSLKGKIYLIVLDDMWKSEAWDAVRLCFPSENKGSGILLTTCNTEVARDAGTENLSLQMGFMDHDESWNLFKSVAFANEALPYEFETIGKLIANECHSDLKACLLHFGIFPEDSEIPVKNLMRSWMAEGFLNLENDLEGVAEKCLQELVDRCLVLVCKKSLEGTKIRSCKVHDLIYDLCLKEVQRGNIFIMNDIVPDVSDSECRALIMHKMHPFKRVTGDEINYCRYGLYRALLTPVHRQLRNHDNNDLLKRTRSIISFHLKDSTFLLKSEIIHFKLLKVLALRHRVIDNFPLQILSFIWLRYLSLVCRWEIFDIPPEICRLWNLQTLIVKRDNRSYVDINCPVQIWGLMQLRHLKLPRFYLPDCPSGSVDKGKHLDFSNLKTICYLSPRCCTNEVILGIQNVKKLGIRQYVTDYGCYRDCGPLNNLIHLHQLETLSFTYCYSRLFPASAKAFPAKLIKLKLETIFLSWSYLDIIAELPNLEVLKLVDVFSLGNEWYPNRLVLKGCYNLKEIPIEFAEIHTLQLIELIRCLPELEEYATRIQKEQEELGNNPVDVRISDPCGTSIVFCPEQIWGLMQLRHIKLDKFDLPNHPSISVD
ncbi:putative WD repeat-containing protein 43-like [Capsicum annuum]|nr:putative WD repeat-containing protein 43-like [Capsicum annuum]